jgi:hypothetical protein
MEHDKEEGGYAKTQETLRGEECQKGVGRKHKGVLSEKDTDKASQFTAACYKVAIEKTLK